MVKLKEFTVGMRLSANYNSYESTRTYTIEETDTEKTVLKAVSDAYAECRADCLDQIDIDRKTKLKDEQEKRIKGVEL